ncbi:unnamed protein product [Spirodela intermedia]|uniref:Uncharacterized protein n=1 Tax=Spirodela intermedia TaxID=51605 RepID=A0A7I8IBG2_SPIIN|nr:unnamed protein product [Spirodela intermedia]CAA6654673.1 unnamed protein product [Spirodela intermedia]
MLLQRGSRRNWRFRQPSFAGGEVAWGFPSETPGEIAVAVALSATGVGLTLEIFADVLNKGNLGGAAMVSFFDWAIKEPNIPNGLDTYHIILKALGRRKFFCSMEEILLRMKKEGIQPDSRTVSVIVDSYVRARRVSKAVEFFERLEEFGGERNSESLTAVIRSLCRRSHVRVADSLFHRTKGKISFDKMAYDELIGGWAKLGRGKTMERTWTEMVAEGLSPDSRTYAHLIEGLGRAGRIKDAVDVFNQMEEKGCSPDTVTYNAMMCNFISTGNLEQCTYYYKEMITKKQFPDIDTYQSLISAFLKVRRGICPSTGMITSFIEPLCSYGPPHAAMLIYKKSKKAGCKISLKAYKLLLMRLSRFGKCGMVLQVWDEMQESGHSSDAEVYEFIVNGLCNTGQLDTAVLVVEESLRRGCCIGKMIYSKLNNKLLEMNKVETAYRLFLKVRKARASLNAQRFWRARGWHF